MAQTMYAHMNKWIKKTLKRPHKYGLLKLYLGNILVQKFPYIGNINCDLCKFKHEKITIFLFIVHQTM
jgi:hypothetical protein